MINFSKKKIALATLLFMECISFEVLCIKLQDSKNVCNQPFWIMDDHKKVQNSITQIIIFIGKIKMRR